MKSFVAATGGGEDLYEHYFPLFKFPSKNQNVA